MQVRIAAGVIATPYPLLSPASGSPDTGCKAQNYTFRSTVAPRLKSAPVPTKGTHADVRGLSLEDHLLNPELKSCVQVTTKHMVDLMEDETL